MAKRDYIPAGEKEFFDWQNNFATILAAGAATWNVPTATLTSLDSLRNDYENKYALANKGKKASRTPLQIKQKKDATKLYEAAIRQVVKEFLAFNSLVSDDDRLNLGITVRDFIKTASTTPKTIPVLTVLPVNGSRLKITVKQQPDADGISRRGKPEDAASFEVAIWIGDGAPKDGDKCTIKHEYTKSPVTLSFSPEDSNKDATIFVRWIGYGKQQGSWSNGITEVISK